MPSGYDKSLDYGGPEPTWWGMIAILAALIVVVSVVYVLRQ